MGKNIWRHMDPGRLPKDYLPDGLGTMCMLLLLFFSAPLYGYIKDQLSPEAVQPEEVLYEVEWEPQESPPQRFVEVTQEADPDMIPPNTNLFAANNSLAAQQELSEDKPEGPLPDFEGQVEDSQKILPDDPIMQELVTKVDMQEALEDIEKQVRERIEEELDELAENMEEKVIEQVMPQPKPRPKIKHPAISAPIMARNSSSSRIGMGVDARFSEFGAYQQRLIEAIGYRWQLSASEYRYSSSDWNAKVHLRFTLLPSGEVVNMEVVDTGATHVATLMCKDAIEASAPFDQWTADMHSILGESYTLNFVFYY